jgi:hypothetical protein
MTKKPYYVEATQTITVYRFIEAVNEEEAISEAASTLKDWKPVNRPTLTITNVR